MDIPGVTGSSPAPVPIFCEEGLFLIPIMGPIYGARDICLSLRGSPSIAQKYERRRTIDSGTRAFGILFPEGGRGTDRLQDFKEGAAYVAIKAGVPVIPIAMTGTREVLPMGSMQIMSGIVELKIGDPISIANLTLKDRMFFTGILRDKVAELLGESAAEPQQTR
jgi:1-acyl-sn-glycerol-3-phosphate acyltransferase